MHNEENKNKAETPEQFLDSVVIPMNQTIPYFDNEETTRNAFPVVTKANAIRYADLRISSLLRSAKVPNESDFNAWYEDQCVKETIEESRGNIVNLATSQRTFEWMRDQCFPVIASQLKEIETAKSVIEKTADMLKSKTNEITAKSERIRQLEECLNRIKEGLPNVTTNAHMERIIMNDIEKLLTPPL